MDNHQDTLEFGEWNAILDSLNDPVSCSANQNPQDQIDDDSSSDWDMASETREMEPMWPDWRHVEREWEIERAARENTGEPSQADAYFNSLPNVTDFLREELGYDTLVDGIQESTETGEGPTSASAIEEISAVEDSTDIELATVFPDDSQQIEYSLAPLLDDVMARSNLPTWSQFYTRHLEWPDPPKLNLEDESCPVCCESFQEWDTTPVELPCAGSHAICLGCAREWFKPSQDRGFHAPSQTNGCPMCREKLFQCDVARPLYYDHPADAAQREAGSVRQYHPGQSSQMSLEEQEQHIYELYVAFYRYDYEPRDAWSSQPRPRRVVQSRLADVEAQLITGAEARAGGAFMLRTWLAQFRAAVHQYRWYGTLDVVMHPVTWYSVQHLFHFLEDVRELELDESEDTDTFATLQTTLISELSRFPPVRARRGTYPQACLTVVRDIIHSTVNYMYLVRANLVGVVPVWTSISQNNIARPSRRNRRRGQHQRESVRI